MSGEPPIASERHLRMVQAVTLRAQRVSYAEIAKRLGCSKSTAERDVRKARVTFDLSALDDVRAAVFHMYWAQVERAAEKGNENGVAYLLRGLRDLMGLDRVPGPPPRAEPGTLRKMMAERDDDGGEE